MIDTIASWFLLGCCLFFGLWAVIAILFLCGGLAAGVYRKISEYNNKACIRCLLGRKHLKRPDIKDTRKTVRLETTNWHNNIRNN